MGLALEEGAFQSRVELSGLCGDIRIGVRVLLGEVVVVQLGVQVVRGDESITLLINNVSF